MLTQTVTEFVAETCSGRADDGELPQATTSGLIAKRGRPSDETLIGSIAAGDRHAMGVLYSRHHVRIYRFIVRLTGDSCLAEDLVSEVFLDAWRSAEGFQQRSRVSTWLLAIARHKTLSAVRRRIDEPLNEDMLAGIEDPADDPEATVEKTTRSAIIQKCLSQLSPAHREVIDLVYYHDASVDEIARIVGIPRNTVKTRMFHARGKLAGLLRSAGVDGVPEGRLPI